MLLCFILLHSHICTRNPELIILLTISLACTAKFSSVLRIPGCLTTTGNSYNNAHCAQALTQLRNCSSSASDEDENMLCKENLSPDPLTSRLHALRLSPPRTSLRPTNTALQPRVLQSLPPKAKGTAPVAPTAATSKAKAIAIFKRQRESMAYQMFQQCVLTLQPA